MLTHHAITALAPDQSSLTAARGLMKVSMWPILTRDSDAGLAWGECQGSGANPYRTVFDVVDHGYKCTCPSRKFPCKHVLALMWMFLDDASRFGAGDVPEWVSEWLGRRRRGAAPAAKSGSAGDKSLAAAAREDAAQAPDPRTEARRKSAAEKRSAETRALLLKAVDDVEGWIGDQLRTGLGPFLDDATARCRAIAARMVDGRAAALASRIDEIPSRLMPLSGEERLDIAIEELGKIVILARAFRASPDDPELRRLVATSQTREAVLSAAETLRVRSTWEVLGERISTRRDGMVAQETWLLNLGKGPRFALLLDFVPATLGKRASSFFGGERFEADVVFYAARVPMRALIAERTPLKDDGGDWPSEAVAAAKDDPLASVAAFNDAAPWSTRLPVLLPAGRIGLRKKAVWWQSTDAASALPLTTPPADPVRGMALDAAAGIWDAGRLSLLAAKSDWGRIEFDG